MVDIKKTFQKPDGERIPLYAEIGGFFSPDGNFDEAVFRSRLNDYRNILKGDAEESIKSREEINRWFSDYTREIVDYLHEKGMDEASFKLFISAVEEFSRIGIEMVTVPSKYLKSLLSVQSTFTSNGKKKATPGEKRKVIFQAAIKVFSEDGFYRATMDKIALVSGVGKGSLYRYFKSKEDLLSELLSEKYDEIIKQFRLIFSKEPDLIKQIEELIRFWVSFIEENHEVYALIQSEAITQKTGNREMFYDYIITHLPMFKERIVAFNIEKKMKTTSFYSVFYGILGFIDGVVYKWTRNNRNYPLQDEIPIILEVLFNGFIGENWTKKRYYNSTGKRA
jgi:AcrR family transcriptional regulator